MRLIAAALVLASVILFVVGLVAFVAVVRYLIDNPILGARLP